MDVGTPIGNYLIEDLLGKGGMAEVYRVRHPDLPRSEALKLLAPHLAADPDFVRRFLEEASATASLDHPNIATIYAVSSSSGPLYYFTMELVEGGDLSDFLAQRGRLPLEEALPLLRQVAAALDYAHQKGIVHRDMKPANTLLKRSSANAGTTVKVVDFGIAKAQEAEGGKRLTKTGMILGTPEYMAPEQATGQNVGPWTDQYALGIMAYELLCGRPPFGGDHQTSEIGVIMSHVREEPPDPPALNPELGEGVRNALLKAIEKQPEDRFASCIEFIDAMEKEAQANKRATDRAAYRDSPRDDRDPQPSPEPPQRTSGKPSLPYVPALIGLVALGALLIAFALVQGRHGGRDNNSGGTAVVEPVAPSALAVKAPKLETLSFTVAQIMTEEEGLKLTPGRTEYSDDLPANAILSQQPAPGAPMRTGDAVKVILSGGPRPGLASSGAGDYAFTAERPVTIEDLAGKSKWDLDLMRNEIYARHGRVFKRRDLQDYFDRQPWYRPNSHYASSSVSALEERNAKKILAYQQSGVSP
jgi:serine/threonine-protein kinase